MHAAIIGKLCVAKVRAEARPNFSPAACLQTFGPSSEASSGFLWVPKRSGPQKSCEGDLQRQNMAKQHRIRDLSRSNPTFRSRLTHEPAQTEEWSTVG